MAKKFGISEKEYLTIEELAEEAGISKELIAKLFRDQIICPVSNKTSSEGMVFHESALRVIKRWEEEIMGKPELGTRTRKPK